MDRRLFRFLILVFILLASQWAGTLHVSGHHGADGDEPQAACELCAVHGMWDHGLAVAATAVPVMVAAPGDDVPQPIGRSYSACPPFHSRAPPVLV